MRWDHLIPPLYGEKMGNAIYGAKISDFTNASPGVITATSISLVGIAAGDTIKVAGIADDESGTSLNQPSLFTVASVSTTDITLDQDTSSGYSAYVSGGYVTRITDDENKPIPIENHAVGR